jgi:hypothetical protein
MKFASVTVNGSCDMLIAVTGSLRLAGKSTVRGGKARHSLPSALTKW